MSLKKALKKATQPETRYKCPDAMRDEDDPVDVLEVRTLNIGRTIDGLKIYYRALISAIERFVGSARKSKEAGGHL